MYMRLGRGFIEDFNMFYLGSNVKLKEKYKDEVIKRIVFFCLQKCDENKNNMVELLSYMNNNFVFDQNLEIKEVKNLFLIKYKEELKNSLNTIWIKEKKSPNANLKERLSAVVFIIDLNHFIRHHKYDNVYTLLIPKYKYIINHLIKEFSLEKYFENDFSETKEVSKNLFNFELSFSLFGNKITTFDNFVKDQELFNIILNKFQIKSKDLETGFYLQASELIKKLESNQTKFLLNNVLLNSEKEYVLSDLLSIEVYSHNIQNYLYVLKKEYEKDGEFVVSFSASIFKKGIFKSELSLRESNQYYSYISERIVSILFQIKPYNK